MKWTRLIKAEKSIAIGEEELEKMADEMGSLTNINNINGIIIESPQVDIFDDEVFVEVDSDLEDEYRIYTGLYIKPGLFPGEWEISFIAEDSNHEELENVKVNKKYAAPEDMESEEMFEHSAKMIWHDFTNWWIKKIIPLIKSGNDHYEE